MVQGLMFTTQEPFHLPTSERTRLEQLSRSTRGPAGLARRARALLLLAEGLSLRRIRAQTGMSPRRIRALEPFLREWSGLRIDEMVAAGQADVWAGLCFPLPAITTPLVVMFKVAETLKAPGASSTAPRQRPA